MVRQRLGDEIAAVGLRSGEGDKDVAGLNPPRIRGQARHRNAFACELFED